MLWHRHDLPARFVHNAQARRRCRNEMLATYGALLARGTENDAKGVGSMIPGIDAAHITTAMRAAELSGKQRAEEAQTNSLVSSSNKHCAGHFL
jgi:hypothetical protein